jgi:hypothetical protein
LPCLALELNIHEIFSSSAFDAPRTKKTNKIFPSTFLCFVCVRSFIKKKKRINYLYSSCSVTETWLFSRFWYNALSLSTKSQLNALSKLFWLFRSFTTQLKPQQQQNKCIKILLFFQEQIKKEESKLKILHVYYIISVNNISLFFSVELG